MDAGGVGELTHDPGLHPHRPERVACQVAHGPAQQVDVARQRLGFPRRAGGRCRRVGVGVGEDVEHQLSGGAVDGGVVVFGQQRPATAVQAVDDVDLPQRPGAVHRPADDPADLLGELVDHAGPGQMDFADVEVEVEVGVGHPVRMVESERHLDETAAQRLELADQRGVLGVNRRVRVVVRAGPFEDHQARDMPERRRRLHVEERGVQAGELLHGRLLGRASGSAGEHAAFDGQA